MNVNERKNEMANKSQVPKALLSQYDLIISKITDIRRRGLSMPYTSINGNMYSVMRKDGALGIRLSPEDRKAFIEKYRTAPFENYGATMNEYVEVPENVLMDTDTMVYYMKLSHEYAKTLKPKPTSAKDKKVTHSIGEKYKNGQLKSTIEDDIFTSYFQDGTVKAQGKVIDEQMNGKWIFNKKGGTLWQIGNFKDNIKNGEWIRYDSKGEIVYHVEFSNGQIVKKYV